jgi:putative transposase
MAKPLPMNEEKKSLIWEELERGRPSTARQGQRREMAINAVATPGISIALACREFQICETCCRYSPVLSNENEESADWLERLTAA